MQVTIDSTEPLERVLPVIGALYGVELAITDRSPSRGPAAPRAGSARSASRAPKTPKRQASTTPRRRGRRSKPDTGTVRAWARAHGYDVKDRGRVPAAVIDAFLADATPAS
jgi:hypothetical protein